MATYNIIRTLSKLGLCSRKQALELVKAGRVRVDGEVVLDPGVKPGFRAKVTIDERPIPKKVKRLILLNKPAGYVTTRRDELGRSTVYELLRDVKDWIFPVGRLDRDSEGLLIFTNDAKFGNMLTDPEFGIERTYEVLIEGVLAQEEAQRILRGIDIGRGERARPVSLKILIRKSDSTLVEVILKEGKNREIRRLFESLGKPVKRLLRTKYGPFKLGDLKPGKWVEVKDIPRNMR